MEEIKTSIYEGGDPNKRVTDIPTAVDLADMQNLGIENPDLKDSMTKAMTDLELKRNQEKFLQGLTPDQKWNKEVMDMCTSKDGQEINTHAFIQKVDSKGRPYLILNPVDAKKANETELKFWPGEVVFLTVDGIFSVEGDGFNDVGIQTEDIPNAINWTRLGDDIKVSFPKEMKVSNFYIEATSKDGFNTVGTHIHRYDIRRQTEKASLVEAIKLSEQRGVALKQKEVEADVRPTDLLKGAF